MKIILPKVIVPLNEFNESPLFFLAGPIRGGGDWQSEMAQVLESVAPDCLIACPCRWDATHRLAGYFHTPFITDTQNRQLHWERYYMDIAGMDWQKPACIIFWLGLESQTSPHPGPEPYAMDTRREVGKWTGILRTEDCARMAVGGHPDFHGLSAIRDELDDANSGPMPFFTDMKELAERAIKLATE